MTILYYAKTSSEPFSRSDLKSDPNFRESCCMAVRRLDTLATRISIVRSSGQSLSFYIITTFLCCKQCTELYSQNTQVLKQSQQRYNNACVSVSEKKIDVLRATWKVTWWFAPLVLVTHTVPVKHAALCKSLIAQSEGPDTQIPWLTDARISTLNHGTTMAAKRQHRALLKHCWSIVWPLQYWPCVERRV